MALTYSSLNKAELSELSLTVYSREFDYMKQTSHVNALAFRKEIWDVTVSILITNDASLHG
jgi:hypothetical protein